MIIGNQFEVLVSLVLAVDAVIIAVVLIGRLAGRRSNRQAASAVEPRDAAPARPGIEPSAPGAALAAFEDPPPAASVATALSPVFPPSPEQATEVPLNGARPEPTPADLDFGPTWVDPLDMAAMAAAEWRHALRRDLARAAHRGRAATVMDMKLDIERRPDLGIQDVAHFEGRFLDTLATLVRSSDRVDRTGPGRFHLILAEMSETGARAIADRIRETFDRDVPAGPRLIIGWAVMETEADIAAALQRAAERVEAGLGTHRAGDSSR